MRTEQTIYGDYIVHSEAAFSASALVRASFKVARDFNENVYRWPVMTDYNDITERFELHFLRPEDIPFVQEEIEIV